MKSNILFILFVSLLSLTIEKEIPQDQKDKCQKVALIPEDCKIELDWNYFCCYVSAKTVVEEKEVNICAVVETSKVTEMVN